MLRRRRWVAPFSIVLLYHVVDSLTSFKSFNRCHDRAALFLIRHAVGGYNRDPFALTRLAVRLHESADYDNDGNGEMDETYEDGYKEVFLLDRGDDHTLVASPLSQFPSEEDDELQYQGGRGRSFSMNEQWLEEATEDALDLENYPLGSLISDDVESIVGLMASWVRRHSVEAALTVERLLKRIVDELRAGNPKVQVNTRLYTIAINAWAKSGAEGGAQRAQHIHDAMVQMYEQTEDPKLAPSSFSYNALMNAWGKSPHPRAAEMAEKALKQMLKWRNITALKPDTISFNIMIDAYSRSQDPKSIQQAEEMFNLMDSIGVRRNIYTFTALQNLYAYSGRRDAPQKALEVLHRMQELYAKGDVFAKPDRVNFNTVLNAYSRTPSKESAFLADKMLRKMELPVQAGGFDVEPDRLSYALAILACARCPDDAYGSKLSEALLEKMEARAKQEAKKREEISSAAPPAVVLDIECFNVVLTAISRSRQPDAVGRTIAIVKRMEEYAKAGQQDLRPTVRSWNAVLNALSRSREQNASRRAEQILNHMFDLHSSGVPNVKPNAFSFTAVLSSYQRSLDPSGAQRVDDIVTRMEELYEVGEIENPPDVYHYTIVCAAWGKSGRKEAAPRCIEILAHMKKRNTLGFPAVKPNVRTYNAVLDCLSRSGEGEKAEQLLYHMIALANAGDDASRPDAFSFNSVINAFTRSNNKDYGKRAEAVLDRFLEYSEDHPKVSPDVRSFTHVIAYYGKASAMIDAPYRAEYLLNRMVALYKSGRVELAPDVFAFRTVMDCYSRQRHPDSGECAERLLRQIRTLQTEHNDLKLEINTGLMNSVLYAWASCRDEDCGRRAEMHLQDMERKMDSGNLEMRPNMRSYSLVLNAWSKSGSFDKAERALSVLNRMKEQHEKGKIRERPNEHAYSLVINTCAFTDSGPDAEGRAFKIAVQMMTEMIESEELEPLSLTYGWFLQACERLSVAEHLKDSNVERAFNHCCERGLVNDFVFCRFKEAASDALFKRIIIKAIGRNPDIEQNMDNLKEWVSLQHLPRDWTRLRLKKKKPDNRSID